MPQVFAINLKASFVAAQEVGKKLLELKRPGKVCLLDPGSSFNTTLRQIKMSSRIVAMPLEERSFSTDGGCTCFSWITDFPQIINIASIISFIANYNIAAYAATKGGVLQMTKAMSNEWASHGITANCICPGQVNPRSPISPRSPYPPSLSPFPIRRSNRI